MHIRADEIGRVGLTIMSAQKKTDFSNRPDGTTYIFLDLTSLAQKKLGI